MIFGRKARDGSGDEAIDETRLEEETVVSEDEAPSEDDFDARTDGPFDADEVDLDADTIERMAFGPLIITTFEGLNLQLHGNPETNTIQALLATYGDSGLELALFAAPRTGGLAAELREETVEEASQAGGHAEAIEGPFGPELRRVLPLEGPEGEQLFHVSRIWLVEGPRWLLRGTLMGRAGMVEGENEPADVFVEFFRNVVVDRDEQPRVPGELIQLSVPAGASQG